MKKLNLFFSLLLIGAMTVSCDKDDSEKPDNDDNVVLVTKVISTDPEGQKFTKLYEYDGTKIKKITETSDWGTTVYTYTYTGDEITKITESNEDGVVKTQSFMYAGGKLLAWATNYETDSETCFFCETVATVEYDDPQGRASAINYFEGDVEMPEKKVTIEYFLDDFIGETVVEMGGNFLRYISFDDKNNPHKNITGWTKLERLNPPRYGQHNTTFYDKTIYYEPGHGWGYVLSFNYDYNSNNFPTTMTGSNFAADLTDDYITAKDEEYFYN